MTKQKHATRTAFVAAGASALLLVTGSGPEAAWAGSPVGAAAPVRVTAVGAPLSVADPGDADAVIRLATAANHARTAAKISAAIVAAAVAVAPPAKSTPRATPAKATTKPTASKPAIAKPRPKPAAVTPTSTKPKPITISRYTNAPGSQAAVDDCKLVLWTTRPMWLAAHNHCGYQWLATVPTGTVITITTGVAAGTYVVTGHIRLARQSGSLPAPKADLVLQTCVGTGTGFTLARRTR